MMTLFQGTVRSSYLIIVNEITRENKLSQKFIQSIFSEIGQKGETERNSILI